MEDKIKSAANKAYYQKKKAEKAKLKLEEAGKANKIAEVQEQLRVEQCTKLNLPAFLAPYLKVNKRFVSFVAPTNEELLDLCMLIIEHKEEVRKCYPSPPVESAK